MLAIDTITDGHLLTPPEREWAYDTIRKYNRRWGVNV